jgi:acyl-CoA thioester hydrolase
VVRLSLSPSTDPASYPFVHRIRTRFAETDAMGVVHHGSYAPYLEEARAALLRHAGFPYDQVRSQGIDFAVLELYVRYRQPLYFDEEVDVCVMTGKLTRTTFQVGYLLSVGGEARATAVTVHGAVGGDGRPARMPRWLDQVIPSVPVGA